MILLASIAFGCYTNHAGVAIIAAPVRVEAKYVTMSNQAEVVRYPLSIFPEGEQRRMAADFAAATGDHTALRIPSEIRRALEGNEKAVRRSELRAEKGLCTKEEARAFAEKSRLAREAYLDKQSAAGRITASERKTLELN